MNARTTAASRLALTGAAAFVVLLAGLHVVRPDLDPSWRMISEYALGRHGWMMTVAFAALAAACIGLFGAVAGQARTVGGRIGLACLLLAAAGLLLAAVFPTDPITAALESGATTAGQLHSLGASLGIGFPFAAALVGWSLGRRNDAWRFARGPLLWSAVAAWAVEIAFSVSMAVLLPANGGRLGPEVPVGWLGRASMAAYCAWIATVAWGALRVSAAHATRPDGVGGTGDVRATPAPASPAGSAGT